MARRELGPNALRVAQAVASVLPGGPVVVGVSGGADSMALALGAAWAGSRCGASVRAVVVDHGLQPGSAEVAARVVARLEEAGIVAEMRTTHVSDIGGVEAAARAARLTVLSEAGHPVLLGHTLDDQAETVLLGLLRGSGIRSLAGMARRRGLFLRPLLEVRRSETEAACREWGIEWWEDPMNRDRRFARVRARSAVALLSEELGRDVAVALARSAELARVDADHLDEVADQARTVVARGQALDVAATALLPEAVRGRVLRDWLRTVGAGAERAHVAQVERLLSAWRGQGPVQVPGGSVRREAGRLVFGEGES
ncbi:tRNA lysidine(34) synthetase TilS [Arachnia propionica]|uniref:tRNA(Ile)-lysidine synthase n=1 Tax=Arachnia propionica TaxID=1750 RepID=A0A3P1T6W8_9ACTN|nr:tRNA lysidine(34) synthetase TilS [Arachnia propionica]RRD04566.1 tRNA lysidine(34) synthetase TilS [Arachnia propionica]